MVPKNKNDVRIPANWASRACAFDKIGVQINAYIKDLLIKHIPNNIIFYYAPPPPTHTHIYIYNYISISILPLLPLILVLYLIFLWSDHRGEYNIIVCIVYNETTERRLMDAPPPIVKDRLRGRKHYYYNQPHHLCSKSGKWGEKTIVWTTFYRTIIILYVLLLPKHPVALSWEWSEK
jgi:hypothetical protein